MSGESDFYCDLCKEDILDVDYVEHGDERHFTCPQCGQQGVAYWVDDPDFRGWK